MYHEATVGAGLPVISTINDLVNTGDKIEKIEGIFPDLYPISSICFPL